VNYGYKKNKDLTYCIANFKLKIYTPYYVHVYLWMSKGSMHRALGNGQDYEAIYVPLPYTVYESSDWRIPVTGNKIGELHFPMESVGSGTVAHELLHFLFDWMKKSMLDDVEDEERLCLLFGDITAQFWRKYFSLWSKQNESNRNSPQSSRDH